MFIMIILLIKYRLIQEPIKIIKTINNFLISHHFQLITGYVQFIQLKKSVTYFLFLDGHKFSLSFCLPKLELPHLGLFYSDEVEIAHCDKRNL